MSGRNGADPFGPVPKDAGQLEQLEEPEQLEAGRYRLFVSPTGLVLARAFDTCQRCQDCGCGTPAEPMPLPDPRRGRAHLMGWLVSNAKAGPLAAVTRMMGSDQ